MFMVRYQTRHAKNQRTISWVQELFTRLHGLLGCVLALLVLVNQHHPNQRGGGGGLEGRGVTPWVPPGSSQDPRELGPPKQG